MKAAIVATVRDAEDLIDDWINYHLTIGFSHIFLFFDEAGESYAENLRKYERVTIIKNDEAMKEAWKHLRSYKEQQPFIDTHVMSRQILNTEYAVRLAIQQGIDWLAHIDCDELFHLGEQPLHEHLQWLADNGLDTYSYLNYEAVVEAPDIDRVFREVVVFKRNIHHLNDQQRQVLLAAKEQHPNKKIGFLAYGNGKSIGRVSPNLVPSGVHYFHTIMPFYRSLKMAFASLFSKKTKPSTKVIILHYPSCGFRMFWKKYKCLGQFPDKWFGRFQIEPLVPFHIASRNIVSKNDDKLARDFYQETVVCDADVVEDLLSHDVYCRITQPSQILSHKNEMAVST